MKKKITTLLQDQKTQVWLASAYILLTFMGLVVANTSVIAFLLFLISLLFLHYIKIDVRVKIAAFLLILVVLLPFAASRGDSYESFMDVATMVGIYICMGLGLNVVVGFAGLLDLGFVAFFALGAYTYAIFTTTQAANFIHFIDFPLSGGMFWPFIILGGLVGALAGVLLGIPVLRVKGDYLAIVTLGFGEIIRIVFNNLDKPVNITNGAMGISGISSPKLFGIEFVSPSQFYYVILVLMFITVYAVRRLEFSKIGRSWKAIRDNEIAAQAIGINLLKTKLMAFAVGAFFSGMMGVVFAAKQGFVDPTSFTFNESIMILVIVVLGGMGSVPGVIFGAAMMTILNLQVLTEVTSWLGEMSTITNFEIPEALSPDKLQKFIFGIALILIALFKPKGLIPAKNRLHRNLPLSETEAKKEGQQHDTP